MILTTICYNCGCMWEGDGGECKNCELIEELKKDSERYRFLKRHSAATLAAIAYRFRSACGYNPKHEKDIDPIIDLAMAEEELHKTKGG